MLDFEAHRSLRQYTASLNRFYLLQSPLWEIDFAPEGFEWIEADAADENMVAYRRFDEAGRELVVAVTFSGAPVSGIVLPQKKGYRYELAFESTPGCVGKTELVHTADGDRLVVSLHPFSGAVWVARDRRGEPVRIEKEDADANDGTDA